jgi:hypothetical protein
VHYHVERNHQGVGNRLIEPLAKVGSTNDPIHCRERLGGMLNFYCREVAWKQGFFFAPHGVARLIDAGDRRTAIPAREQLR